MVCGIDVLYSWPPRLELARLACFWRCRCRRRGSPREGRLGPILHQGRPARPAININAPRSVQRALLNATVQVWVNLSRLSRGLKSGLGETIGGKQAETHPASFLQASRPGAAAARAGARGGVCRGWRLHREAFALGPLACPLRARVCSNAPKRDAALCAPGERRRARLVGVR